MILMQGGLIFMVREHGRPLVEQSMDILHMGVTIPTALPSEMAQWSSSFKVFMNNLCQSSGIGYLGRMT
jgi:hypothetical protein